MNLISKYRIFVLIIGLTSLPALAAYQRIDTIIATVSNDVITQSDLDKKIAVVMENFSMRQQTPPSDAEVCKEVLDRLIIESLQLQLAAQAGIQINDERLAMAMTTIAKRKNLTDDQFRAELTKNGIPYEDMREQIRMDLTLQQLQQAKLRNRIQISEQEVDNYLNSAEGQKAVAARYKMSHILLEVGDNATEKEIADAKNTLNSIRDGILSGQYKLDEVMAGTTINGISLTGTQMDWLDKNELPTLFAKQVQKLKKGDISKPVRSGAGWHLLVLNDSSSASAEIVHQISSRHILIKPSEVRNNAQTKALADDLYARIHKGDDFALLAKEYSEDPGSALQGGELGWSKPAQFVPEFANTMISLKKGEISKPFKTEFGWHIMQKIDERDHDMTLENQKNQAYQALYERKFKEELDTWLITIREEAFIEIKN